MASIAILLTKELYDIILYSNDAPKFLSDLFKRFQVRNVPRIYQIDQAILESISMTNGVISLLYKDKDYWQHFASTTVIVSLERLMNFWTNHKQVEM